MREQVGDKTNIALHPEDLVVKRMTRWSAMLISRFSFPSDGRTAFERRRGRKCEHPVAPMGEKEKYGTEKLEKAKIAKTTLPAHGSKEPGSDTREIRQNSSLAPRRVVRASISRCLKDQKSNVAFPNFPGCARYLNPASEIDSRSLTPNSLASMSPPQVLLLVSFAASTSSTSFFSV